MISVCIKDNNINLLDYLINEINNSGLDNIFYSRHSFRVYENLIVHYKGENKDFFYDFLSKVVANAIIIFYEEKKVRRLIHFDYFYFNKSIVLEGFLNFRLREYIAYLRDLLQEAVNQFILDKEYIEFVNLLKDYVDSKVPNKESVNLIYVNNEALLLSQDGNIIALDKFDSKYLSDISFSNNDYVLNTLVGIIPSKIYLHLVSPKDNFIKTIELIFGDRVKYCQGCQLCSAYEILNLK